MLNKVPNVRVRREEGRWSTGYEKEPPKERVEREGGR